MFLKRGDSMELKATPYDEVALKIKNMMQNEEGIKEIFERRTSRLISSSLALLVIENEQEIGFVYLTSESISKFLFVDIGIKKQFRGNGYSEQIMNGIKQIVEKWEPFVIAETKVNNISANSGLKKIGRFLYTNEDTNLNYYLIQDNRYDELINNQKLFESLKKHNSGSKDYHGMISNIHDDEKQKVYTKRK